MKQSVLGIFMNRLGAGLVILAWSLSAGCGPQTAQITKECNIPEDQSATITGHWTVNPVPVAVIANDFSSTEVSAISAAISTWNAFFSASKGFTLYLAKNLPVGTSPLSKANICSQNFLSGSGFSQAVQIVKRRSGWTYGSPVIGYTSVCRVPVTNSPYQAFYAGVIEVNFANYFVSGQPVPDLQSVMAHELGHLLGINHSCYTSAAAGKPACADADPAYIDALMYPVMRFNGSQGIASRTVRTNDQQRANCLY